jgi:hypothetical protein
MSINVVEIVKKHYLSYYKVHSKAPVEVHEGFADIMINENFTGIDEKFHNPMKEAIKEIVEAIIDKCAEESKTKDISKWGFGYVKTIVDKQSILNVKKMINYE